MREIKFRGKRVDNGEWVYGWYVGYSEAQGYIHRDYIDKDEVWSVDAKTVGQYTGLEDKNGVEIYEGDILHNVTNPLVDKLPFQIEYRVRGGGYCWLDENGKEDLFYDVIAEHSEIVGNIHDNPELMEVEQ